MTGGAEKRGAKNVLLIHLATPMELCSRFWAELLYVCIERENVRESGRALRYHRVTKSKEGRENDEKGTQRASVFLSVEYRRVLCTASIPSLSYARRTRKREGGRERASER